MDSLTAVWRRRRKKRKGPIVKYFMLRRELFYNKKAAVTRYFHGSQLCKRRLTGRVHVEIYPFCSGVFFEDCVTCSMYWYMVASSLRPSSLRLIKVREET